MQVLYADGYEGLEAEGKYTYSFDGQSQSLDHVLANEAAAAMVTGVDIWEVNANETVFNQYSRYNYNATILYEEAPVQRVRPQPGDRRSTQRRGADARRGPDPGDERLPWSVAAGWVPSTSDCRRCGAVVRRRAVE